MFYQILPNIILILAVFGVIVLIARRLPQAAAFKEQGQDLPVEQKLLNKGLPAQAISKIKPALKLWLKRVWNFILEAKDLKPAAVPGYKLKKIFRSRFTHPTAKPSSVAQPPASTLEIKNEKYFLELIKNDPKNSGNYDALGKFYSDTANFQDAKDVYLYLTGLKATNPDYHAKLAFCLYQLKQYDKAAEHYRKSLRLDSTHPNRYYNLGLSLEAKGDMRAAIDAFNQAIALEPNNSKFHASLANAYKRIGEPQKAKDAEDQAPANLPSEIQKKIKIN